MLVFVAAIAAAHAVTARWSYEDHYDNVEGGDWYLGNHDDYAPYLSGGQSAVMRSLAAMFRTTGDPVYLERLAYHVDGVLAQRNDARGVTDFTGEKAPCWRGMCYSGGRPNCWVLHSGEILTPIVELAWLVQESRLGDEVAYDGLSFAEKAATYVASAQESVAFHDPQWHEAGYYVIRGDATFLGWEAGTPNPMNCSHAMGRALQLLYELTGEEA